MFTNVDLHTLQDYHNKSVCRYAEIGWRPEVGELQLGETRLCQICRDHRELEAWEVLRGRSPKKKTYGNAGRCHDDKQLRVPRDSEEALLTVHTPMISTRPHQSSNHLANNPLNMVFENFTKHRNLSSALNEGGFEGAHVDRQNFFRAATKQLSRTI